MGGAHSSGTTETVFLCFTKGYKISPIFAIDVTALRKHSECHDELEHPSARIGRRVATVTRGAIETREHAHREGWRAREGAALISIE